MARIVFCWEIGAGFGHLTPIAELGQALRDRGHEVHALITGAHGVPLLQQCGITSQVVPNRTAPPAAHPVSINYAANLLRNGYWHAPTIAARVGDWSAALDGLGPELLIADHAPAALLASRRRDFPRIVIGNGFTLPPAAAPMPSLQPWLPLTDSQLAAREQQWLQAVNEALSPGGGPLLDSVSSLFEDASRWLCIEPELDHYAAHDGDVYCGSLTATWAVQAETEVLPCSPFVFVYLSWANRFAAAVLTALQESGEPAVAYMVGQRPPGVGQFAGIHFLERPIDLAIVADRAARAVTEGGTYTAAFLLKRGVPLIICPRDLEKALLGWRLAQRDLARTCNWFAPPGEELRQIRALLRYEDASPVLAAFRDNCSRSASVPLAVNLADRCEELLS